MLVNVKIKHAKLTLVLTAKRQEKSFPSRNMNKILVLKVINKRMQMKK